ncbi:MAG TPA: hypothetical protein PLS29_10255 [Acidimicrobiales bacterium]|nr:MAG: hypothetical protein B7Z69_04295 [Actinobacteria bacterium 21-73-9]HQU27396.1 hypothetical protein [Acidimicrobiales bacterium]
MLRRVVKAALAASLVAAVPAALAGGAGLVPPRNPAHNVPADPAYSLAAGVSYRMGQPLPPCWRWRATSFALDGASGACVAAEVAATDHAHALEHLAPLRLPRDWARLSVAEQLFVLADVERVSRGEPPILGLSRVLDAEAQVGAAHDADPVASAPVAGATGAYTANWAGGDNALDANYSWMYLDGWAGAATTNLDCTAAGAPGCWGHRDNILVDAAREPCPEGGCALVMGAGYLARAAGNGYGSFSELIVQVAGASPPLFYTWRQALAAGARP